jgi:hypothetical protein
VPSIPKKQHHDESEIVVVVPDETYPVVVESAISSVEVQCFCCLSLWNFHSKKLTDGLSGGGPTTSSTWLEPSLVA